MDLLSFKEVGVTYPNGLRALDSLSFSLSAGRALALSGSNGSGKSTALRVAARLLPATDGSMALKPGAVVAYAPERFPQNLRFTGIEYLVRMGCISGMDPCTARSMAQGLLEVLGLGADGNAKIPGYSKGMRQKVCLAQALMTEPDLVILDEPMSGLDTATKGHVGDLLLDLKAKGVAILFSTHEPGSAIADDCIRLEGGRVAGYGFPSALPVEGVEVTAVMALSECGGVSFPDGTEGLLGYRFDPMEHGRTRIVLMVDIGHREAVLLRLIHAGANIISVRGPGL